MGTENGTDFELTAPKVEINTNGESKLMGESLADNNNGPAAENPNHFYNFNSKSTIINEVNIVFLESDTEALSTQIAGHSRTGVLKHKILGYVLKPLQKEPLGPREVDFYKTVFDDNLKDSQLLTNNKRLREFIPKFHGLVKIHSTDQDNDIEPKNKVWKYYLAVEDIGGGFQQPCVIDIKIGAITWDPLAPPNKVEHEKSKYTGTKKPLGLSLTGMQYFDLNSQKMIKMQKERGKSLVKGTFIEALQEFLNTSFGEDAVVQKTISRKIVTKLKHLLNYFEEQRDFYFYSSSILITYDATKFNQCVEHVCDKPSGSNKKSKLDYDYKSITTNSMEDDEESWLSVKMIDFAHVFNSNDSGPDENYLFGLRHLLKIFQDLQ